MNKCFVGLKGIKCPTHSLPQSCDINQKWIKAAGPISKRLFDPGPNQSGDKRPAKFCTKKQNLSIPFTFPSRRLWHCPQNCKKEISRAPPKKVVTKQREPIEGNSSCGSVEFCGFLTGNIRRWVPVAVLAKMATAGRICNASRGISLI